MLAFLNLSVPEVVTIAVVAVLVFGRRLPEVAGQAAGMVQRMRRSIEDLRRESGIDRELRNARKIDEAVPRQKRHLGKQADVPGDAGSARPAAEAGPDRSTPGSSAPSEQGAPPTPADDSQQAQRP